jgi:hypothetical protein
MRLALLLAFTSVALPESLRVYTEFERIDPFGNVIAADKAQAPREVLSPALARNAWTTFQVVVEPAGQPYTLFIAQNPERSVEVKLYRASFVRQGEAWVPDRLDPVTLAESGAAGAIEPQVPGQKVLIYWMDVWVRADAPVGRSRLELQLAMDDRWTIYPMEVRVQSARPLRQPAASGVPVGQPAIGAPSSAAALAVMRAYVCGAGAPVTEEPPSTIRGLIRRNALQDQSLARSLEHAIGRAGVARGMLAAIGARDPASWCRDPKTPPELGAEWYLRVRDYLYKAASQAAEAAPLE